MSCPQVISGEEHISSDAATQNVDVDGESGSVVGSVVVILIVVALICCAAVLAVYCVAAKRKRDRELEAMAAIAALPGFQVVQSEDMPFEVGKSGYHAVVPSWDLGRVTPQMQAVSGGHSRVPSMEQFEDDGHDTVRPSTGNHLALPR